MDDGTGMRPCQIFPRGKKGLYYLSIYLGIPADTYRRRLNEKEAYRSKENRMTQVFVGVYVATSLVIAPSPAIAAREQSWTILIPSDRP